MRQVVATALLIVCCTPQMSALQSRGGTGAGTPANRACSLLTKERVLKTTPYKDTSFLARGDEAERHRVGQYPRAGAPVMFGATPAAARVLLS